MHSLKSRICKMEKTVLGEKGIAKWALERAKWEALYPRSSRRLSDEPLKLETDRDILDYARMLSTKYRDLDDYYSHIINPEPLRKALESIIKEQEGNKTSETR